MTSFAITVCGQCCLRHVVGQQVVSDIVYLLVVEVFVACVMNLTNLPKVIWEEGRVAAL